MMRWARKDDKGVQDLVENLLGREWALGLAWEWVALEFLYCLAFLVYECAAAWDVGWILTDHRMRDVGPA